MIRIVVLCVAAWVVPVVLTACGQHEAADSAAAGPEIAAQVVTVQASDIAASYEAVGTVRAKVSSVLQSKVTGYVSAVQVKEGDAVTAGQVLVELDNREAAAELRRAESALQEAQQARREVDSAVQAAVQAKNAAEAGASIAQTTFKRYKALAEKEVVSRQAFDEASARWTAAAAEAARAGEMVTSSHARRSEADARVAQAEAALVGAQTMQSYSAIVAPFAGVITRKMVEVGNLAAPGAPLLEMEDPRQYRLEALVDEANAHGVVPGVRVKVMLDAPEAQELDGTVAELVTAADPASRTFLVKVDLPAGVAARSGTFGRAQFAGSGKACLTAPASAVVERGQLSGVFVVAQDGVARWRIITVGKRFGEAVEVLSGLEAGERIV
ncbi:MAG: efflux RND transporter periplasmic adaptor subunit, partial [Candidatus Hydrogenedentes bacterium]|nr:efflux RND transporter periplasmic adaptor subunit [Candidatus Hydrogenedentota bacterium]